MTDTRIGRVLVASLHQAIADLLPTRLEFYENWINSAGLREGTIGLAPLTAVLSFLRHEGSAYGLVMARAGDYAADWTVATLPKVKRAGVRLLPAPVRMRLVLRMARRLVRETYAGSRAIVRLRRGTGIVDIRGSLFCEVREAAAEPLCGYYAAAIARLLESFNLPVDARVSRCRAVGGKGCLLEVTSLTGPVAATVRSVLLLVLLAGVDAAAQTPLAPRLLVSPFENVNREARIYWLGEASAVLLADALRGLGVNAITRDERVTAFERLHLPEAAALSLATVIKVGQIVGASEAIIGTLRLQGDDLTVRAQSIRLDTGRMQPEIMERGPLSELFVVFERLARRLAPGRPAPAAASSTHPSLEAFEQYIKGLIAETAATRVKFLESALRIAPAYDQARLALWHVRTDAGEHQQALQALEGAADTSPFRRHARFFAALSRLELKQYDAAFSELKALADGQPSAAVWNNLGIVQLRRGTTFEAGRPVYFFTKAADLDPDDAEFHFNLGYAYVLERDMPAGIYWLREAVRRTPTDGDAHFVLGAALHATGAVTEAAREKELAQQLSSKYVEWEKRRTPATDFVPRGLERVKADFEVPRDQRLDAAILNTAQREQREIAAFHLDRGRRLFEQESDREAIAELRRSIYLSPYHAEAHLLLGRIYLRSGRAREAVDALKLSLWSEATAPAHAALGEALRQMGDAAAARAQAQRALSLDPNSADARALLARLDRPVPPAPR